jgi:hypothetical protein
VKALRLVVGFLVVGLFGGEARADDVERRSTSLFQDGVAAAARGEYERARAAFRASYDLSPAGTTLHNLAVVEIQGGRVLDGLRHLKDVRKYSEFMVKHPGLVDGDIDRVYREKVARLAVEAAVGARVDVDGEAAGVAPFADPIPVLPGEHQLVASLGDKKAQAAVDALVGAVMTVDLSFPLDVGAPSSTESPPQVAPPPEHITGQTFDAPTVRTSDSIWTPGREGSVGLGAAALLSLGLGVYFQLAAVATANDVSALRSSLAPGACVATTSGVCTSLRNKRDDESLDVGVSELGYGLAAVAASAAIVMWVVGAPRAPTSGSLQWAPLLGVTSFGLRGEF